MRKQDFTVFIVDDDLSVLKALARLVKVAGYAVQAFSSPQAFLAQHDPTVAGCAIIDIQMPDLDGLELQAALRSGEIARQLIFITGTRDVPASVEAMKGGALDVLAKPVNSEALLSAIVLAFRRDSHARKLHNEREEIRKKLATLTPREAEVLRHVVSGRLNKQIANDLGTVEKTIKVHRGRLLKKLGVRSIAALVRLTLTMGIAPSGK